MRLFIAVPLPKDVQRAVYVAEEGLRSASTAGRFVPASNFHVTLRFLGESNKLADIAAAMHDAVKDARPEYGFAGGKVRFTPHITLARAVEHGDLSKIHVPNAAFSVRSIVLFESTNENGRMVYTPVHTEVF